MSRNPDYSIAKERAAMLERRTREDDLYEKYGQQFETVIAAMPAGIVRISVDTDGLSVSIAGDKHILASAIRALRTHGYQTSTEPPTSNSPSWSAFYERPEVEQGNMTWEEKQAHRIWLSFTSTVCRRIKVGEIEKTTAHKEPIYETICGEMSLPA